MGVGGADGLAIVDRDEVDRLRKRFMKLDKVGASPCCSFLAGHIHWTCRIIQEQ